MRGSHRPSKSSTRSTGVRPPGLLVVLRTMLFVVLLILIGSPAAASVAATTAWRSDGYGPGNTGYNPIESTITTSTVGALTYNWSIVSPVVRNSCSQQSPPVVANGKLYLTDQRGIAAYDAVTGVRIWTYQYANPLEEMTPRLTVVGSRLFAAFNGCRSESDPDGQLRAFNADTGVELWTVRRDAPMYTIVVDKDIVVVAGQDVYGPVASGYRVSDGTEVWTKEAVLSRPVSANGRVLLDRYADSGSDLVDIRTGKVLWSSSESWSVLAAGPAGGPLYATNPAGMLARINAETGATTWSVKGLASQVSVDAERLYTIQGGDLVVLDAVTGAELWRASFSSQLGKPVVAGGVVYVTVSGVRVVVLDAASGDEVDEYPPYDDAVGHPVVVNGMLYVTSGRVLDAYKL